LPGPGFRSRSQCLVDTRLRGSRNFRLTSISHRLCASYYWALQLTLSYKWGEESLYRLSPY